jgi:micrococcal nuclease
MCRHRPVAVLALLLLALLAGCPAQSPPPQIQQGTTDQARLVGKVVKVADGDTITILINSTEHRIRLHGIDCPEKGQPFCNKAKEYTSGKVFGKEVVVEVKDVDQYGRRVGVVLLPDGMSLNHMLVNAGLAWHYRKYAPDDQGLATLEKEAREAKAGLWADAAPVPPWEWRKR